MTDLEKAVARALRLSDAAAVKLLDTIQRNIETARAELIRSGVSEDIANGSGALIEDAIISFCLMRMTSDDVQEYAERSFLYAQENLRKS